MSKLFDVTTLLVVLCWCQQSQGCCSQQGWLWL